MNKDDNVWEITQSADSTKLVSNIKGGLTPATKKQEFKFVITPEEAKKVSDVHPLALLAGMYYLNRDQFIKMIETWNPAEFTVRNRPLFMACYMRKLKDEIKGEVLYDPPEIEQRGFKRIVVDGSNPRDVLYTKYWVVAQHITVELKQEDMFFFPASLTFVGNKYSK